MRDNKKKIDGKMSREEYLYHNTEMLLTVVFVLMQKSLNIPQ